MECSGDEAKIDRTYFMTKCSYVVQHGISIGIEGRKYIGHGDR